MKQQLNLRFAVLTAFLLLAAFSRIIPHPYNFFPLAIMGLFGAAYFTKKWQAILLPLAATWLSDVFINNVVYAQYYPEFTWFYSGFYWVYGSYAVITILGFALFNTVNLQRILSGSILATSLFFLITNFGSFIGNPMYPQSFEGLMMSYAAGIPFLQNNFLGDLFYSAVLFGGFALAGKSLQFPAHVSKA